MTKRLLAKLGKPSGSIYKITTRNSLYRELKMLKENRKLSEGNLKKLKEAILKENLLELRPIIIWEKGGVLYIADGQHRYRVALEENLDYYVQYYDGEITPEMITMLNTNQKNWTISDFARSFATINGTKRVYSKYCDYYENNNVTHQILISLYNGKNGKGYGIKEFKKGELKENDMIRDYVDDRLYKLRQLEYAAFNPSLSKVTQRKQSFHTAILNALSTPKFKYTKFLKNLYSTKHSFNKYHNIVDMENEIFRIERAK
jgi:arsenate reductase-like glutaredoxin family protein